MMMMIIIIIFYELQYTYCNMKFSTLLAILIHNITHNMLHECFCKFITWNFTRIKGFGSPKKITAQLLTSSAAGDIISTQHICWQGWSRILQFYVFRTTFKLYLKCSTLQLPHRSLVKPWSHIIRSTALAFWYHTIKCAVFQMFLSKFRKNVNPEGQDNVVMFKNTACNKSNRIQCTTLFYFCINLLCPAKVIKAD